MDKEWAKESGMTLKGGRPKSTNKANRDKPTFIAIRAIFTT